MWIINILGFLLLVFGFFKVLGISFFEFILEGKEKVNRLNFSKKRSIKKRAEEARNPRMKKGFGQIIHTARQMLILTGKRTLLSWISFLSVILFVFGVLLGVFLNNYFLAPVLGIGFGISPFVYVLLVSIRWQRELGEELETGLSIITSSYLRKEDIISAIAENVGYLNEPIKSVFESFVVETNYINSNTKAALRELQKKIYHDIFYEWCEAVIACQENKEQKIVLMPIVTKLSDSRIVTEELQNIIYEALKDYIMVLALFLANYPLLRLVNKDWYLALTDTTIGKIVIAMTTAIVVFTLPRVIALTRNVTHKEK